MTSILRIVGCMASSAPKISNQNSNPPLKPRIREYRPETDHSHVVEICRNVYGGTDALPSVINAIATESQTKIFALDHDEDGTLHALLCCQVRGTALWVWGARTREELRGKGFIKKLLTHVEAQASRFGTVTSMLSVTILANEPMRHVFKQHGYEVQCQVDIVQINDLKKARDISEKLVAEEGALLPLKWRYCTSSAELISALLDLRKHRTPQHLSNSAKLSDLKDVSAFAWLPGEYVALPADCSGAEALINEEKVWLLENDDTDSENGCSSVSAVMCMGQGDYGPFVGIVAGGKLSTVALSMQRAWEMDETCSRVYIDWCEQSLTQKMTQFGEVRDYLVMYKRLEL